MNYLEYKNKCRICLKDDADIRWDNVLNDYSNQTYKDCYYKYTQLERFDDNNFSELLCRNCSDGLEYIDSFISNALETHFVLDNYRLSMEIKNDSDVIDHGTTSYEVIFIEEAEQIESLSNSKSSNKESNSKSSNKELPTKSQNNKPSKGSKMSIERLHKQKEKSIKSNQTTNKLEELNILVDEFTGQDIKANDPEEVSMEETSQLDANKESENGGPICCSICSKVFPNKSSIIRHEETHNENRERNETCNVCGLAVYNKKILKYHMETHSTNREKLFQCEYCNKTFYHKGSLNRHRRLHLDEMFSCSICNKEFYRQTDLDEHMHTHSGEKISSIARQKIHRYFHCKDCGKNIRADNFNSHTAVHMNAPLFKCSICKRGYFRRYRFQIQQIKMNCLEFKNKCRICLKDDADINWDNVLYDYSSQTYKDCYYKYTQLECFDDDNFSYLLCHNCSDGLEYVDTFISKALDTHLVLDNYRLSIAIKDGSDVIDDGTTEFEEMFIEEAEPKIESLFINENSNTELPTITHNTKANKRSNIFIEGMQKQEKESVKSKRTSNKIEEQYNLENECTRQDIIANDLKIEIMEETSQLNAKRKLKNDGPMCCSICSKVFPSKYTTIRHEKTHNENRERNETCNVCGLTVYNKKILKYHMETHSKNREKPHKCEFCDKAFYHKGSLNIHRRLHLGQMISCIICTKEFYRQIDLDQHMFTHSAERINSNAKPKTHRYFRCKDCGKDVRADKFNSHTAIHMNEPLFKCSICNKEFFRRDSCSRHIKKIHQKTSEEFTNFIIAYKPNRRPRLYLQQNSELQILTE